MGTEARECSSSSFAVFTMIFIHYIYKYNSTDRLTLSSFPTRETKHQIGMALLHFALSGEAVEVFPSVNMVLSMEVVSSDIGMPPLVEIWRPKEDVA